MGRKLVIVESPAKAKTINKILGADYTVKACMGHVRDLPVKRLGVDVRRNFKPEYEVVKGREKIIKELAWAAKQSDGIYLAPDPDREGEAIAWHLRALLEKSASPEKFHRVFYNEITPRAVRQAFEKPTQIDQKLVDAQQARRILDRIVGYKVSPLLWSRVRRGTSAGRVQSVALRLVCEREDQIRNFKPEEYWVLGALVRKQAPPQDPFRIKLAKIDGKPAEIRTSEQAQKVLRDLDDRGLRVAAIHRREIFRRAPPPFITSSMQQAASSVFGFSPGRTMRIAQGLYEGVDLGQGPLGLITYMRTDSFSVARDAQEACRRLIAEKYGADYVPEKPNFFQSRRGAQEAHEAIRPTDVTLTPENLGGKLSAEQQKLYGLIWRRFVASQMVPARIEQRTAEIEALPGAMPAIYLFRATASQLLFPGFMQASGIPASLVSKEKDKDEEGAEEGEVVDRLPPLTEGENLDRLDDWLSERKETQPPGRYSEASLIRALEENGIGRPSTYAQILSTLQKRRYVQVEKRAVTPTSLGEEVNRLLVSSLETLFNVGFTAEMEKQLDEIEEGKVDWVRMLSDFYGKFQDWMKAAKGPGADPAKIERILAALRGVREWAPEVKQGERTLSDRKFVQSLERCLQKKESSFSERQLTALGRLAWRYKEQVPDIRQILTEVGMERIGEEAALASSPAVTRKLEALKAVQCDAPVERGGRMFDDRAFIDSLQFQVSGGQGLSEAQLRYLDRLVVKYAAQIPDFAALSRETELDSMSVAEDTESGPLLEQLRQVKEWRPPVKRGRRTMDDRAFFESLARQFGQKRRLSVKQIAALKKLADMYRRQNTLKPDEVNLGKSDIRPG